jgi:hypothetical protein
MSTATKRPWKVNLKSFSVQIFDEDEKLIAGMLKTNDAELIVRAVNCHDELLDYFEKDYLLWKHRYETAVENKNRSWLASYSKEVLKMQNLYDRARGVK